MSPEPLHDVLEALVRSLVAIYKITPVRVRVDIDEDPGNPLSWRVKEIISGVRYGTPPTSTPPPTTSPPKPEEDDDEPAGFSQCITDIIEVLEKAKKRLTTTRLLSALSQAGKEWSARTVSKYLALMVGDGTLTNDPKARPPGYGLPEWDSTFDKQN